MFDFEFQVNFVLHSLYQLKQALHPNGVFKALHCKFESLFKDLYLSLKDWLFDLGVLMENLELNFSKFLTHPTHYQLQMSARFINFHFFQQLVDLEL